jgi:hypothetical protein
MQNESSMRISFSLYYDVNYILLCSQLIFRNQTLSEIELQKRKYKCQQHIGQESSLSFSDRSKQANKHLLSVFLPHLAQRAGL